MKWKCARCRKVRGKRNPKKDGWTTVLIGGMSRPLCPKCSAQFQEAARVYNQQIIEWAQENL